MKIRVCLSLVLCFFTSILWAQQRTERFTINGHISGVEDGAAVYLYDIEEQLVLDSALIEERSFRLSGKIDHPTTCWVKCQGEYAIIQLENVDFTFSAAHENMHLNSRINGGREQALQNELQVLQRPWDKIYYGALDSLMQELYTNEEQKQRLIKRFREAQATSQSIYIDFGIAHSHSFLGLDIIYRNRKSIPKDTLEHIYRQLPNFLMATSKAQAIKIFLYDTAAEKGQAFIDFSAQTTDGKDFQLSTLKGQYIYLSFWSAGCGPCRMENKFLSEHYNRIPENLAIVSFSVDRNRQVWAKASKQDGISWHNVSDLAGGQGQVKTQYQVQAIPTSFLINPEGRIVEIFTGFDPSADLIEELAGLMKHHE